MTSQTIVGLLETESQNFTDSIIALINQAVDRRKKLEQDVRHVAGLDRGGEQSEDSFFTALESLANFSGDIQDICLQAGFDSVTVQNWIRNTSAPPIKQQQPILEIILASVMEQYAGAHMWRDLYGVLDTFESGCTPPSKMSRDRLLDTPTVELEGYAALPARAKTAIEEDKLFNLRLIVNWTEAAWLRIPNCGRKSVNPVKDWVAGFGLSLGCLTKEEEVIAEAQRKLALLGNSELTTKWRVYKPEYAYLADLDWQKRYRITESLPEGVETQEEVQADHLLLTSLTAAGITCRSELATAPKMVLDQICGDNDEWVKQLPKLSNLPLYLSVPAGLPEDVKIFGKRRG